jgi:PAS domain-containing protein
MVGGICLRNFGTPRLAATMTFATLAPCALGGLLSGDAIMAIITIQLPIFMMAIFSASFRLHRMLASWMTTTAELKQSKALNETILQSNPDLTLIVDKDYKVVFSNRQPEELGCEAVLVGRPFLSILRKRIAPPPWRLWPAPDMGNWPASPLATVGRMVENSGTIRSSMKLRMHRGG